MIPPRNPVVLTKCEESFLSATAYKMREHTTLRGMARGFIIHPSFFGFCSYSGDHGLDGLLKHWIYRMHGLSLCLVLEIAY